MHRFLRLSVLFIGLFSVLGSYAADAPQSEPADPGIEGSAIDKAAKEKSDGGDSAFDSWLSKYFDSDPDNIGPVVKQPIEFPHFRHAGDHDKGGMEINCMYCHTYARRSLVAGIPPVQKCIGCHENIESVRNKPRIKKLFEYWEGSKDGKIAPKSAIPWKKVHDLPDFVRFSHERHIQRFIFQLNRPVQEVCGYCHGDVKEMTVARRQKLLSMGFCVTCHEIKHPVTAKDGTPIGDQKYWYSMRKPIIDVSSDLKAQGPNDCWECHK
jgi:hypothetical protein